MISSIHIMITLMQILPRITRCKKYFKKQTARKWIAEKRPIFKTLHHLMPSFVNVPWRCTFERVLTVCQRTEAGQRSSYPTCWARNGSHSTQNGFFQPLPTTIAHVPALPQRSLRAPSRPKRDHPLSPSPERLVQLQATCTSTSRL